MGQSPGPFESLLKSLKVNTAYYAIQFRFTYIKSKGVLAFDDVVIKYNKINPSFIQEYNDLKVSDTSFKEVGLDATTKYYYRAKAVNNYNHSDYSNVISVITCTAGACDGLTVANDTLTTVIIFMLIYFRIQLQTSLH